jgi:phosphoserine aminotransferase
MSRKYNFYAGPATLPLPVLTQIKEEMEDFHGIGMSLIETSHRSKTYDGVHNEAIALLRELLGIPANYQVIFLGGGATLQFSMIPMNFLSPGKSCDFTLTGAWAKKAYEDAAKVGKVKVVFDGKESGYTTLPAASSLKASPGAAYFHLTSNETIEGVEWVDFPDTGDVPLIADMSSDIMSRPLPVEKFGVIYAGAQKNLGPAGVTLVILREDLLERCPDTLTAYLNYKIHAEKNSLYNTPPVFSIYALKLVLEHVKKQGGLAAVAATAAKKAGLLYRTIDDSDGFYRCPVDKAVRSRMNVVFRLPSEDLEKKFIDAATEKGMVGLKGHRSVGGCRASLYNAMPEEGVAALTAFMKEFAAANG